MTKAIPILLIALTATVAQAVSYGNWIVMDKKPDPFNPELRGASAHAWGKSDHKRVKDFGLSSMCFGHDPDRLYTTFAAPEFTNLRNVQYDGEWVTTTIDVLFEGGAPHAVQIWVQPGSTTWFPSDSDQTWLASEMVSSERLLVRWQEYDEGSVTATIDLDGGKAAINAIKRRCNRDE